MKALQSPKVRERMVTLAVDSMNMTPDAFAAYVHSEIALNADLVRKAGIKPD